MCMLNRKNMPGVFWGKAVATTVFILNRSPTRSLVGMTPYEALKMKRPPVHFLRAFGCVAHTKDVRPHLKKMDDWSAPMVFIAYERSGKYFHVYEPIHRRIQVSAMLYSKKQHDGTGTRHLYKARMHPQSSPWTHKVSGAA